MSRNQLKTILKINGYTDEATDDEIRAVLLNAHYNDTEIEQALLILRAREVAPAIRSDGLHTVFYTDNHLRPSEISGLLGIDVDFNLSQLKSEPKPRNGFTFHDVLIVTGLAIFLALLTVLLYMYLNQVGVFHSFEILN